MALEMKIYQGGTSNRGLDFPEGLLNQWQQRPVFKMLFSFDKDFFIRAERLLVVCRCLSSCLANVNNVTALSMIYTWQSHVFTCFNIVYQPHIVAYDKVRMPVVQAGWWPHVEFLAKTWHACLPKTPRLWMTKHVFEGVSRFVDFNRYSLWLSSMGHWVGVKVRNVIGLNVLRQIHCNT